MYIIQLKEEKKNYLKIIVYPTTFGFGLFSFQIENEIK